MGKENTQMSKIFPIFGTQITVNNCELYRFLPWLRKVYQHFMTKTTLSKAADLTEFLRILINYQSTREQVNFTNF